PISGDTVERIFYCVLNEPLNLEPLRAAAVPDSIVRLVAQCTAKKPEERPQGFTPIVAELERVLAGLDAPTTVLPQPPAMPQRQRRSWPVPAIVALAAALGVGAYYELRPAAKSPEPPKSPEMAKTLSLPSGDMVLVPAGPFLFGENKEQADLPAF